MDIGMGMGFMLMLMEFNLIGVILMEFYKNQIRKSMNVKSKIILKEKNVRLKN
jgi:hypothetical protein